MNRNEKGLELMNLVFGEEQVQNIEKNVHDISPPFLDFLKGTFSDIYGDDTLDLKTKEIIVLTTLITQKDTKPQLKIHILAAMKAGVTQKEILAMIKHLTLYIGFPSTLNALTVAKEVFDECANKE